MENLNKETLTPFEKAFNKKIENPNDILDEYEALSLLIYCWRNNKDLIDWLRLLSDKFIDNCVNKRFSELKDIYQQDLLQFALCLNCLDKNNWGKSMSDSEINDSINKLLVVGISIESINRRILKDGVVLPGSGLFIDMQRSGKKKYNFSSYIFQANQEANIEMR